MDLAKTSLLVVVCLTVLVEKITPSQDIMHQVTKGFTKVFQDCKSELKLGDDVLKDFFNFWKEDYEFLNRDLGCMVICMASKFDLIDENNKMLHGNAHAFAKAHGADDEVAKQIVTMIHECETPHNAVEDHCMRVVEVFKCFRKKINALNWAPSMEVILEELMTLV